MTAISANTNLFYKRLLVPAICSKPSLTRGGRRCWRRRRGRRTLKLLRRVLDADDLVGHVTSSADADRGKPHPDIVSTALERAQIGAGDAIFVGDAVWDMQAGKRAGVPTVGLLSGGASRKALLDAGAVAIYDDPRNISRNSAISLSCVQQRSADCHLLVAAGHDDCHLLVAAGHDDWAGTAAGAVDGFSASGRGGYSAWR